MSGDERCPVHTREENGRSDDGAVRQIVPCGPRPGPWSLVLSGGGVRAALCSIGALFALRRVVDELRIASVVSTSGGSVVNTAMMVNAPADEDETMEWMDAELVRLFDALRLRPPLVCLTIGLAGSALLILYGAFAAPGTLLSRHPLDVWGWVLLVALSVWLAALVYARVVVVPLCLLAGAVAVGAYDASAAWEGYVAAVIVSILALVLVAACLWRRRVLRPGRDPDVPPTRSTNWLHGIVWFALVALPVLLVIGAAQAGGDPLLRGSLGGAADAGLTALRLLVLGVLAWALWQWFVLPSFVRAYFGSAIGDPDRRLDWAEVASRVGRVRRHHALYTTELRDEVPAAFTLIREPTGAGTPRLHVHAVDSLERAVTLSSARVGVVTSLAASASFVPVLSPVVPLGTRRLDGEPRYTVPYWHVFADGGLNGTLLTQSLVDMCDLAIPRSDNRLVLDATRRRARAGLWFLLLLPKLGAQYVQLRLSQTILSSLVNSERTALDESVVHFRAQATGARFDDGCTCTGEDVEAFRSYLRSVRERTDRFTHWWPTRSIAASCVAAGAASVVYAIEGPQKGWATLQKVRSDLTSQGLGASRRSRTDGVG